MGKLVLFMHTSLDGFTTRTDGSMNWVKVNEEIFDYAGARTQEAGTALYGRNTYEMMQAYWPTAGDDPDASKHDIEHSAWYNKVDKVVVSKTMKGQDADKLTIISEDVTEQINKLKQQSDKEIIIFGSPTLARSLMSDNLIDEYWLFINPIILGKGKPYINDSSEIKLKLVKSIPFTSGVVCLHYAKE